MSYLLFAEPGNCLPLLVQVVPTDECAFMTDDISKARMIYTQGVCLKTSHIYCDTSYSSIHGII